MEKLFLILRIVYKLKLKIAWQFLYTSRHQIPGGIGSKGIRMTKGKVYLIHVSHMVINSLIITARHNKMS